VGMDGRARNSNSEWAVYAVGQSDGMSTGTVVACSVTLSVVSGLIGPSIVTAITNNNVSFHSTSYSNCIACHCALFFRYVQYDSVLSVLA